MASGVLQYLLDPKIANLVSKELEKECIVVFDEAHNIDNVCVEAYSVKINRRHLHSSTQNLRALRTAVADMEQHDQARLDDEYRRLVSGLINAGTLSVSSSCVYVCACLIRICSVIRPVARILLLCLRLW